MSLDAVNLHFTLWTPLLFGLYLNTIRCNDCEWAEELPEGIEFVNLVTVTIGEEVRMPCLICDEKAIKGSKQWKKRQLPHHPSHPVRSDLHNDDQRNRVVVTSTHDLLIKEVVLSDVGYYFCYDENGNASKKMSYLVDIVQGSHIKWKILSKPEERTGNENYYTERCRDIANSIEYLKGYYCLYQWSSWSSCDACNTVGKRERNATCRLMTRYFPEDTAGLDPNVAESGFPLLAAACHSYIFDHDNQAKMAFQQVPNLIYKESCEIDCGEVHVQKKLSAHKEHVLFRNLRLQWKRKEKERIKISKPLIKTVECGSSYKLTCPGVKGDVAVTWYKDGREISQLFSFLTKGMEIESEGVVYMENAQFIHSGVYSCFVGDVEVAKIRLEIVVMTKPFDYSTNFGQLMLATIFNFFMFLLIMVFKWLDHSRKRKRIASKTNDLEMSPLLK